MERLPYRLNTHNRLAEEGAFNGCSYAIMGYAGRYDTWQNNGRYLPIKMEVLRCMRNGGKVDLIDFIYPLPNESYDVDDEEFRLNWVHAVHGEHPNWILVKVNPLMTGVVLTYYNPKNKAKEDVCVNIAYQNPKNRFATLDSKLELQLNVPHADGRPDTIYLLSINYTEGMNGKNIYTKSKLERFGCDNLHRKMNFQFERNKDLLSLVRSGVKIIPDYADVVDYTDI